MSCGQMCVTAFGLVGFKQQLTCWGLMRDWTLQDKAVPYKIQIHTDTISIVMQCSARRGSDSLVLLELLSCLCF